MIRAVCHRVCELVSRLNDKRTRDAQARRKAALRTLKKYRGRLEAGKFSRDELNDRSGVR